MTTVSSGHPDAAPDRRARRSLLVPEMWAALAISVIWVVVLVAALFGPDLISSTAGASFTRIPSGIAIAFFAWLATWVIARHGFVRRDHES